MDSKLVLFQCITLLFRESQLERRNIDSRDLVKEAVNTIKLPEAGVAMDYARETLVALRSTALHMVEQPADFVFDHAHILNRIRISCGGDESLYKIFETGMTPLEDQDQIKRRVLNCRQDLSGYMREIKIREITKQHYARLNFSEEPIDWKNIVNDMITDYERLNTASADKTKEGVVDEIDFADATSVQDAMDRAVEENAGEGMLMCGFQGVNRMLGGDSFYRRGDFVVVGALQHNYKSGWISSHFRDFATLNRPYMRDPTKKPLLLGISTENSLKDNIMWLYSSFKELESLENGGEGEPCDTRNISTAEASSYVIEKLRTNGYEIRWLRVDPSDYTYRHFYDLILQLETEGYEIHAVLFDYLNMISKKGCNTGPMGTEIRDLFRRVRNFCNPRGILFMTPHQLSSDAKSLLRGGVAPEDFVKEIANKGYWDSCRLIDQEVDLEIYIHLVKREGRTWMTIQRGKHRKFKITPEIDLYTVYELHKVGGWRPDFHTEDQSSRRVGAKAMSEGGGPAWYD